MIRCVCVAVALGVFVLLVCASLRSSLRGGAASLPLSSMPVRPVSVAVDDAGRMAYVALNKANAIAEVDLSAGRIVRLFPTGRSPRAVALAYGAVCVADDEADALVIFFNRSTTTRVPVVELPAAARQALREEQPKWLLPPVARPTSALFADTPEIHGALRPLDLGHSSERLAARGPFSNEVFLSEQWLLGRSSGALGFAGGHGQLGGSYGGFGGWNRTLGFYGGNAFTGRSAALPVGSALPTHGVSHPWIDAVFVSISGSDCLLQINARRLRTAIDQHTVTVANEFVQGPPKPPDYVVGRIPTGAFPGPLALSGDGRILVAANVLGDSLTVIECSASSHVLKTIPLSDSPDNAVRRGERLFHSARLSRNGQFACASCHPGGGSDGIAWNMPGDEHGSRVTKSLLGVRDTAPYGWRGEDATLEQHVQKTLKSLFGHEATEDELGELTAYLKSLAPPIRRSQPFEDASEIARGRELFHGGAQCNRCHLGDTLEDGSRHDVGTGGSIDTPSLRGVGTRFSLLHHGQALDFSQVLTGDRPHRHGRFRELYKHEQQALIAYLRSL